MKQLIWLPISLMVAGWGVTSTTGSQTFTSLVHLAESIQAEKDIIPYIESYVEAERKRLDEIEKSIENILDHHKNISLGNVERHLSNPVNAFILIQSMHKVINDSRHLIDHAATQNKEDFLTVSNAVLSQLPTKDDLDGAILALLRLQDTYKLTTSQLSDSDLGLMNHEDEAPPLNGDECYSIGQTAHFMDDFYHAVMWFQKALEKYEKLAGAGHNMTTQISSTLDFLNFGLYKQDNIELAIAAAEKWVQLIPGVEPGTANLRHYYNMLSQKNVTYNGSDLPSIRNIQERKGFSATVEFKTYESLCQGRFIPELRSKNLGCHNEPILYSYFPAKVEVLNDIPRLVYYHHIMSDKEVEIVKDLARPKLERSGVFASNAETPNGGIKTTTRVSKSAWLWDNEDETIATLSTRFSRITGLTIEHAESLQVLNYGIGGHYEPHCDFAAADNPNVFLPGAGNRIATFILYLSDVEKGGATVFPRIGATVWPERGGAAFWYNIKSDGSLDDRTLHGACPVLVGYKWVCNKWFHESGNEFTRPCPLTSNPEQ